MGAIEALMTAWVIFKLAGAGPYWPGFVAVVLIVPAAWAGGVMRVKQHAVLATSTI
jgi:hypothetical protein